MNQKHIFRTCGIISGLSGLVILFATLFPIAAYEWESSYRYPMLLNPLSDDYQSVKPSGDLTKASNWFVGAAKKEDFTTSKIQYFTLTVPKLNINNATVAVGGEDLAKNLIQYPGTALPGKPGNTVIFGHSILPIFYDPNNYMAIFSTLNRLKKDDEIFVNYDGINYKFAVEDIFEVHPTDIQILDQDTAEPHVTLVTCSPPGDPRKLKRLIVRARLIPFKEDNENIGN